jgi:hypothetical protein
MEARLPKRKMKFQELIPASGKRFSIVASQALQLLFLYWALLEAKFCLPQIFADFRRCRMVLMLVYANIETE